MAGLFSMALFLYIGLFRGLYRAPLPLIWLIRGLYRALLLLIGLICGLYRALLLFFCSNRAHSRPLLGSFALNRAHSRHLLAELQNLADRPKPFLSFFFSHLLAELQNLADRPKEFVADGAAGAPAGDGCSLLIVTHYDTKSSSLTVQQAHLPATVVRY